MAEKQWQDDNIIRRFQLIREKILQNYITGKMAVEDASREVQKLNSEIERRYMQIRSEEECPKVII